MGHGCMTLSYSLKDETVKVLLAVLADEMLRKPIANNNRLYLFEVEACFCEKKGKE